MCMSLNLISYVLKAAFRDKIILSFCVIFLVTTALSLFMGDAAIIEKNLFALTFTAGSLRMIAVIGLILFVVFFIRRSYESRDIEFLLSRPISKLQFILSYVAAFCILALMSTIIISICLLIMAPSIEIGGYTLWCISLFVELSIMATITFFFSMVLSSAAIAAFISFGFYALSRMMGQILGIIDHNSFLGLEGQVTETVMLIISLLTPRLDLMGQSSWLLYGAEGETNLLFIGAHGLSYLALIILATFIDLWKKQF